MDKSAGDAAPYLSRCLYEFLDFQPAFDTLPSARQFKRTTRATGRAGIDRRIATARALPFPGA